MPLVCILAWPGAAWPTVAPAAALLADLGPVRVGAPAPGRVEVAGGPPIFADISWEDARAAEVVVVPGGDLTPVRGDPDPLRLLRDGPASRVCGAIGEGIDLLHAAGAVAGKRTAGEGADVVTDGNLVTARPWAAVAFAVRLARILGMPPDRAAARARWLTGTANREGIDPYERFAILLSTPPGAVTTRDLVRAHVDWLRGLEARGHLDRAGPFPDHDSGLVVLRGVGAAEARELASADPFVASGIRTAEVRRWWLSCEENGHLGVVEEAPPAGRDPAGRAAGRA